MTARLVVDLRVFRRNLDAVRRSVAPADLMLVVKDDAYGHGIAEIVRAAIDAGVTRFVAFTAATGAEVRVAAGAEADILVLLASADEELDRALTADLQLGVGSTALLDAAVGAAVRTGVAPRIHLKIDTGLHRNGIRPEEWPDAVARAATLERAGALVVDGVWSHISEASDADDDAARVAFDAAVATARDAGLSPRIRHLAASAASFARAEFRYDAVRIGAFCYGIRPAGGPGEDVLGIHPVASLRANVVDVAGDGVRVDVGALHGLPSTLAGLADVDGGGEPRRLISVGALESIVETWPDVKIGDDVIVYGAGAAPSATDLAELIDTIGEEIALRVNPLVERVYIEA
ncbi:alanine racemase [Microbacterium sp. ASV49]|uniref:Alanine racemase n=1 Tax=Microbacterium candidum TaxID=3041922 RepID=A0ABT7MZ31_9MICO|nr:alanine racemase [Microbacterium sp. ASV49]MDL9979704.1 alanine racemase [Microbacterium sp. ASV49]